MNIKYKLVAVDVDKDEVVYSGEPSSWDDVIENQVRKAVVATESYKAREEAYREIEEAKSEGDRASIDDEDLGAIGDGHE